MKRWSILYRGPLSSCNYGCDYCPFAKTKNTRQELTDDARALGRFVAWAVGRPEQMGVLFTPWGEALIRPAYQRAFRVLSHAPNVHRVVAQTNLSCRLDWLAACNPDKVALWCTYHPSQVDMDVFVAQTERLRAAGIRHSVGMVGLKEDFERIAELRRRLPETTYLWVNAYKRQADYYAAADVDALRAVDPLFDWNNQRHASRGHACQAGVSSFTVDGDGTARRCHFIPRPIGNVYAEDIAAKLRATGCENDTCGCHIGYVHLDRLGLDQVYGDGLLERIPTR